MTFEIEISKVKAFPYRNFGMSLAGKFWNECNGSKKFVERTSLFVQNLKDEDILPRDKVEVKKRSEFILKIDPV